MSMKVTIHVCIENGKANQYAADNCPISQIATHLIPNLHRELSEILARMVARQESIFSRINIGINTVSVIKRKFLNIFMALISDYYPYYSLHAEIETSSNIIVYLR